MLKQKFTKKGFTLIELLTVIAILAILGAIIFPTVGSFRTLAKKTSDSNDLRRIVSSSQMFAAQNGERFVDTAQTVGTTGIANTGGDDIVDVAAVLAIGGELNDPEIWVSENETKELPGGAIVEYGDIDNDALTPDTYAINSALADSDFSFSYVTGLATYMESTTPVAFSRKNTLATSTWEAGDVYEATGGHIAFLGGSVSWYEDLSGKLIDRQGGSADNLSEALGTLATNVREAAQ